MIILMTQNQQNKSGTTLMRHEENPLNVGPVQKIIFLIFQVPRLCDGAIFQHVQSQHDSSCHWGS